MPDHIFYRAFGRPVEQHELPNRFISQPRQPRSMDLDIHHFADQWFDTKFKVKARSNCIFVGRNYADVEQYLISSQSVVKKIHFPAESIYIYSVQIKDLVVSVNGLKDQAQGHHISMDDVAQLLTEGDYQLTQDPLSIPTDAGEIMVYCHKYFVT